jgi:hypothetical protein
VKSILHLHMTWYFIARLSVGSIRGCKQDFSHEEGTRVRVNFLSKRDELNMGNAVRGPLNSVFKLFFSFGAAQAPRP